MQLNHTPKRPPVQYVCPHCGNVFQVPAWRQEHENVRFCSRTCRWASKRHEILSRRPCTANMAISEGYCNCGCGKKTSIAAQSSTKRQCVKGEPLKWLTGHCGRKLAAERFWAKVDKDGPIPAHNPTLGHCWVWTAGRSQAGYGAFGPSHGNSIGAHRVAYELTHGLIQGRHLVLHHCDNPLCVRPDHLFLGTQNDNVADKCSKDRQAKGTKNGSAKITEQDVLAIRQIYLSGNITKRALAKQYGIHETNVRYIVDRLTWKHVP